MSRSYRERVEEGIDMVKRLGGNYLYVRELEDRSFSEGLKTGTVYGIVVCTLVEISLFVFIKVII